MFHEFTKLKLCFSGFAVTIENNDDTKDQDAGVRLDFKGHATTNKGGIKRQIDIVNEVMNKRGENHIDVTLLSCGGVHYLLTGSSDDVNCSHQRKMNELKKMMEFFSKVGKVYESLAI